MSERATIRPAALSSAPLAARVATAHAETASSRATRTAVRLALFAFLIFALTGGGRIVGSDEVAMLELARSMLRGGIAVPEGATLRGPDGRDYTKNAAAQAVIALPLVAAGEVGARVAHLTSTRATLAVRFVASFMNAVVTAILLGLFYGGVRRLGIEPGAAMASALMLGFATPLWPYAKTFMAEPLQALGVLMAVLGVSRSAKGAGGFRSPEALAGAGAFLAVSVKLSMLPIVLGALAPMVVLPPRTWRFPAAGVLLALVGHAVYDVARFGTPFETGYGAQATGAAYTTPILVGLYGLLLSSGKGVAWFAPPVWLAISGFRRAIDDARTGMGGLARLGLFAPMGRVAWSAAIAWVVSLVLYARFQHWAGDGSFGPRYLLPVIPLAMLLVPFALKRAVTDLRGSAWGARPSRGWLAIVLGTIGVIVQIGGVGIYFGAQMREAGDYPYRLPLDHPRFMSDSHFNPRFSPIAGHWSLLARNLSEHLRGEHPRLDTGGEGARDTRLGLTEEDQRRLLHAIDVWWLYLAYAGYGPLPTVVLPLLLGLAAVCAAAALRTALLAESRAP
jgi:hypothetical protein